MIGGKKKQISQSAIGSIVFLRHAIASYQLITRVPKDRENVLQTADLQSNAAAASTRSSEAAYARPRVEDLEKVHYFGIGRVLPTLMEKSCVT